MRTFHLINSAMMPAFGRYRYEPLTAESFGRLVQERHISGNLRSYIGYEQTAELVSKLSGVPIPVNRAVTSIKDGDILFIVKLRYRPDSPTKGQPVNEDDFEFGWAFFEGVEFQAETTPEGETVFVPGDIVAKRDEYAADTKTEDAEVVRARANFDRDHATARDWLKQASDEEKRLFLQATYDGDSPASQIMGLFARLSLMRFALENDET